ncbi:ADL253Cp [Eremothecium gossypii ATCC 10895]|uniref:ADL253Cp n=2 Tax=Eremothecium gossypii TaxID=33169 RepID=Q75B30_EREGS|nr:ADL253Cp [Eremothecium gossypii ATCC 10895]AAS51667.2 ADL253Cp [Eremothecium gossypii ATCC 10895]AEY95964.1 FADL253Cp [Eremothecium gossypii FDAG1]
MRQQGMSRDSSLAPLPVHVVDEPPLVDEPEGFYSAGAEDGGPIAIDFGSYEVRAGYVANKEPALVFPTRLARYRDRKASRTYTFVGRDTGLDASIRTQSRSPFDGPMVTNWDYVDDMLAYTFHHLGVRGGGGVPNAVVLTERLATLQSQRANWYELLYEAYNLQEVTFGIDSLFSFYGERGPGSTGLVVSSGNEDTCVVPVVDGRGVVSEAKRINWGGQQAVDYLTGLLALKYPYFPTKLSGSQFETIYREHCYVAEDFEREIDEILQLPTLEAKNVVVEAPFTEVVQVQKTEEELRLQAEKRRETGKRLQEQARQRRKEKLVQKEEEYEYYLQIRGQLEGQPKKNILATLQNAGFDDEDDFNKYITSLERSLKRARVLDANENEEEPSSTVPNFDLVNIPDEELNDEQRREKKKQRLMKANYDARMKAKEEKLEQQKREEDARLRNEQWRKDDLKGWIKEKRSQLTGLMKARKEKLKMKEDMKDRKSQAAQKRMKNIASLAEDNTSNNKRSRQQATIDNDPNDTFGANDDDWMIYNDISQNPEALDEALEEEYKVIVEIEKELLEHDPHFTEEDTLDAQYDWRNSTLHLFLRGPRPHDSENIHEQHQMHINVERIRVPEVIFQPSIGGLDQAGVVELCETVLLKKFDSSRRALSATCEKMAKNVFITGGNTKLPGIRERIVREFTGFLPVGTELKVTLAKDPSLSAWKGMAKFASDPTSYKSSILTKREYEEYGPEYIKEHNLGNAKFMD